MDQIKNHIKKLLNQNLFLNPELYNIVLSDLDTLSIEKLIQIEDVLARALKIQHKLLVDLIKKDPTIANKITRVFKQAHRQEQIQKEERSSQDDTKILKHLEEELNALFQ